MNYITDYSARINKKLDQQDIIETISQFYDKLKFKQNELEHISFDSFFNQQHLLQMDETNKQFVLQLLSKYKQENYNAEQFNNFQAMYPFDFYGATLYKNFCRKIELYNGNSILDTINSNSYQCFIEEHNSTITSYKIKLYFRNKQPFNLLILKNFIPLNLGIESVSYKHHDSTMKQCEIIESYVQTGITQLQFKESYTTDFIELTTEKNSFVPSYDNSKKIVFQNSLVFNQQIQPFGIPADYNNIIQYDPFYSVNGELKIQNNEIRIISGTETYLPIINVSYVLGGENV